MVQTTAKVRNSNYDNKGNLKLVASSQSDDQQAAVRPVNQSRSWLAPDIVVHGTVTSRGNVEVAGTVHGDIRCVALEISPGAQINGKILAGDVVVGGAVDGPIKAHRVSLKETAKLKGNIHHKLLSTEHGAVFEGRSCQSNDPTGAVCKIRN